MPFGVFDKVAEE